MKITNPYGPNTTILLPGSCSAACDFCFWNREEGKIKPPADYLDRVESILLSLPPEFKVISISGGEPTESRFFIPLLNRLNKIRRARHFDRVVLTTNGSRLSADRIGHIGSCVDHINISRHGIGNEANRAIFKANIPCDNDLFTVFGKIHNETDCDVTLNCVVDPTISTKFCFDFIDYAKQLGADAVSFRKVASDVKPTFAEEFFRNLYGVASETKCPVCRGMEQDLDGFKVRWKGSVSEPSIETEGVYEVIIHPDGNIYADWGMQVPLEILKQKRKTPSPAYRPTSSCGSSGCGSKSSGGC